MELMTTEECAAYLKLAPQSLANMRSKGEGPPYRQIGRRVRYDREEVDAWVKAQPSGGGQKPSLL